MEYNLRHIKTTNQLVNTIIFPGSVLPSSYSNASFPINDTLAILENSSIESRDLRLSSFLIYIPIVSERVFHSSSKAPIAIPALLCLAPNNQADFFIIHFHANSCDIGEISFCADLESLHCNSHYLILEYPGYGIAEGFPSEHEINRIARIVYDYIISNFDIPSDRIIIFGRSIGTGPACKLAGDLCLQGKTPAGLILQSPYCSIHNVTKDLVCDCITHLFLERFANWEHVCHHVSSPTLIIHADQDKIIDIEHSKILFNTRIKNNLPCKFFIQKSTESFIKTHNMYDYFPDLVYPIKEFLNDIKNDFLKSDKGLYTNLVVPLDTLKKLNEDPNYKDEVILSDHNLISAYKWGMCLCFFCCEFLSSIFVNLCCCNTCSVMRKNHKTNQHVKISFYYPGKPKKQKTVSFIQSIKNTINLMRGVEYIEAPTEEIMNPINSNSNTNTTNSTDTMHR